MTCAPSEKVFSFESDPCGLSRYSMGNSTILSCFVECMQEAAVCFYLEASHQNWIIFYKELVKSQESTHNVSVLIFNFIVYECLDKSVAKAMQVTFVFFCIMTN